ncbi:hypothetical protein BC351_36625 [Paenibacillus ferrarius]|uniref:DUF4303 domain-containing protein n=1 Tax=Paenibacillus ferrarius TaxID=1469647 RepID=A0A1V4HC21_9BACL|nr:hypothetical protein [Paenibacillus ferrarius]OPH50022.1 hypothetical protein BC351_36625 [Paenibacillus ferrarius]
MKKEQLLKEMKQDMLREIRNAVKEIKLRDLDEVCYISLFGTESEPVLGLITLGIKSFRDEMIQEEVSEKLEYLWNSAEMPANYQVGLEKILPSFQNKQELFMELTEDDDWEETWEASQNVRFEVAYELNSFDWSGVLPITSDFVIYSEWEAIVVEDGDLTRSIPTEKLQLLKEQGLA